MQIQYERTELTITAFDVEDVITTSGAAEDPTTPTPEDPIIVDHGSDPPFGTWF